VIFRRHYTNAELLEYLDGEARLLGSRVIPRHLETCWQCRTSLRKLDQQIQTATEVFGEAGSPGAHWSGRQKRKLLECIEEYEQASGLRLEAPSSRFRFRPLAIAAGTLIVVFAISLAVRTNSSKSVTPGDIAARSVQADAPGLGQSLHQTFSVNLRQIRPAPQARQVLLQLWYDPAGQRFSSRLEDPTGRLRFGLWREAGKSYSYRPARTGDARVMPSDSAGHRPSGVVDFSKYDANFDALETVFMDWLESREWKPILLGSDIAILSGSEGEWMRAKPSRNKEGREVLLLTAEKTVDHLSISVAVEIDPRTYRSQIQRVRMTTPERTVEISMIALRRETLDRAASKPALFRPDASLVEKPQSGRPAPAQPGVLHPVQPVAARKDYEELDDRQVEVLYALHRVRADSGETVIVTQRSNRILVEGLTSSAERKQQILEALAQLPYEATFDVEIQTVQEASISARRTAVVPGGSQSHPVGTVIEPPAEDDSFRTALRRQLQKQADLKEKEADARILEVGNRAVGFSSQALELAWAVRRLSEAYPPAKLTRLQPHSRWLIESMLRDFTTQLQADSNELRRILDAPLRLLGDAQRSSVMLPEEGSAKDAVSLMFEAVRKTRDLIHSQFAGLHREPDDLTAIAVPERAAAELLVRLEQLSSKVKLAGEELAQRLGNVRTAADHQP
jgi:hypothetical protein